MKLKTYFLFFYLFFSFASKNDILTFYKTEVVRPNPKAAGNGGKYEIGHAQRYVKTSVTSIYSREFNVVKIENNLLPGEMVEN